MEPTSANQFAQVSDPHLSDLAGTRLTQLLSKRFLSYLSWRRRRRFEHRREVLEVLAQDLATLDLCQLLVTGDLTHTGLPDEFRQARRWLESLGAPADVAVIPGNHDALVRDDPQQTLGLWQDYMASDPGAGNGFPSLRLRGELAFIGLSSACPTPPLMASGKVDEAQLGALRQRLEDTRGKFRVVYVHHSPVAGVEKWRKALRNADALTGIIGECGAELVLHGHGHRTRLDYLPGSGGQVPVIAVPSASARGLYGADVAAYNRYQVDADPESWKLTVEQRRLADNAQRFEVADETLLTIPRVVAA